MKKNSLVSIIFFVLTVNVLAQKDTIWTVDGNVLSGKFKSMDRKILYYSTDNSYNDFEIKWDNVLALKTINHFKLLNSNGKIVEGTLLIDSLNKDTVFIIRNGSKEYVLRDKLSFIDPYSTSFRDKTILELQLGYTKAKQNNNINLNASLKLGYKARIWEVVGNLNRFANQVDTIISTRTEAGMTGYLYLPHRWFLYANYNYFSSSQLKIIYRSMPVFGIGNYLIQKRNLRLNLIAGVNLNEERYDGESKIYNSKETYGLLNFEYYPTKDIDLGILFITNPSLETNRIRYQLDSHLKFKFYKNFNFRVGYKYNFDSSPKVNVSQTDYLFDLSIGWKLNG